MTDDLELARRLGAAEHGLVVVAVTRGDGTVHTSVVNAGVLDDPASGQPSIGFVARGDARKLEHIRRSGRATVVFRAGWEWVSVEGPAHVAGSGSSLLRAVFIAAGGTHDDWDEFDRVMADERRVAVLVEPQRITGNG